MATFSGWPRFWHAHLNATEEDDTKSPEPAGRRSHQVLGADDRSAWLPSFMELNNANKQANSFSVIG